jgi:putative peptidoglycan lipid II flippase
MQMATFSLQAYSLGVVAFMLIKVLAPGFFARQDMRTPVRIGIIALLSNMLLNLLFLVPLHLYWQIGHVGLALATSVSAYLNAALLFHQLRRQKIYHASGPWSVFGLRLLAALAAMLAVVWLLADAVGALDTSIWQGFVWWQRGQRLLAICAGGAAIYAAVLFLVGFRIGDLRGPKTAVSDRH